VRFGDFEKQGTILNIDSGKLNLLLEELFALRHRLRKVVLGELSRQFAEYFAS